jgi:hypothetical protein
MARRLRHGPDQFVLELASVSWTPDYAGDRVGRSPSWVVRTSTPISSARTRWSW